MSLGKRLGFAWIFAWFFFGGIGHFTPKGHEFFVSIVPPYIPWHDAAVYVSGVFELLGAFGIFLPQWRRAAGIGLFLLTLAVTPANVWMWQHPELYPQMPPWALSLRLVIQVALLANIWWCTGISRPLPEPAGVRT